MKTGLEEGAGAQWVHDKLSFRVRTIEEVVK